MPPSDSDEDDGQTTAIPDGDEAIASDRLLDRLTSAYAVSWIGAMRRMHGGDLISLMVVAHLLTTPAPPGGFSATGLATALALILLYGRFGAFRMSWLFILVGHVLFTLPFMVRSVLAVLSSIDLKTLEEGAASLGAGFVQRFFGIVLPNCRSGILAGALMVVTLSIGEFNMTWMLHTPLTKTLPVGLADSYASMRLEIGSAYTIVFFFMIVPLLLLLQRFARIGEVGRR